MGLPINFLARFAIPLIVATFYMEGNGPDQASLYGRMLQESDQILSLANGEGDDPTESYDYVIIGAGSAGAVLANRLTASGTNSVLVLEGGGDPNPLSEVPWFMDYLGSGGMLLDYSSTKQEHACRTDSRGNGVCIDNLHVIKQFL